MLDLLEELTGAKDHAGKRVLGRITGTPVSLLINLSSPFKRDPPPVMTIPRSTMSAASSGGVFSSACLMAVENLIDRLFQSLPHFG